MATHSQGSESSGGPSGSAQQAAAPPQTFFNVARETLIDVTLIVGIWCLSVLTVSPLGDFPLNDDWAYGTTVRRLLLEGQYRPVQWALPPFLSNMLWGTFFSMPGQFSFTALRFSTLCGGLLGLLGLYLLLCEFTHSRWVRLTVTLSLGLNPIYFALSHTFMTDVLFTTLLIWAAVFFARSLKSGGGVEMLAGALFAVAATLSRQLGICVALAFTLTYLLRFKVTLRTSLCAATPSLLCFGSFLCLRWWLVNSGRSQGVLDAKTTGILQQLTNVKALVTVGLNNIFVIFGYLGLFLLPILVMLVYSSWRRKHQATACLSVVGLSAFGAGAMLHTDPTVSFLSPSLLMPTAGNILDLSGIGPLTLRDTFIMHLDDVRQLPAAFWLIVTAAGMFGSVLLIVMFSFRISTLTAKVRRVAAADGAETIALFLFTTGILYLLALLVVNIIYDRYLLPLIPFLGIGLLAGSGSCKATPVLGWGSWRAPAAVVILICFGVFSVGATHDYLAWNRTRWQALRDLMDHDRVSPQEIDGGFEFNGLYLYDPDFDVLRALLETLRDKNATSWWWISRDTYLVSFGPVPGYSCVKQYGYRNWFPWYQREILVLRRE